MEFDDYESLPTNNTRIHMMAGAVAGIMEHCFMYPIDSVKTRMQSLNPAPEATYRSLQDGLVKMINTEGIMRTLKGVNAVILGAGPAHALYFSAYEGIRAKFPTNNAVQKNFVNAAAGCGATLLHDAIMVPSEVVKQRMQMFKSPYTSCYDCMCRLYCAEGFRAFYRSYSTQVLMNIPFHALHIVLYELFSDYMNPKRQYDPTSHVLAGGIAGGIAAGITTPMDTCKTLLNTQEAATLTRSGQQRVEGLINAMRTIHSMHGFKGFFRGLHARILYQAPGTAISWSVYELFKHMMSRQSIDPNIDSPSGGGSNNRSHLSRYDGGSGPPQVFPPEKQIRSFQVVACASGRDVASPLAEVTSAISTESAHH